MTRKILVLMLMICVAAIAQQRNSVLPLPNSGNVSLSLEEYNRLVELATKPTKKPELPPINYSVNVNVALQLRVEAGRAQFSVPVPVAGGAQLSLVVPGEHTLVNVSPGLITNRTSENGHTTIEATLPPGQTANIWWATREAAV